MLSKRPVVEWMRRLNVEMPVTGDQIKAGATWTVAQVRRVMIVQAILGLFLTAVAGFGTYWYASYVDIATRLEARLPELEESRDNWVTTSASVFTRANANLAESPGLPSTEEARRIQEAVTALISELNTVPTPTARIEDTAGAFRSRLSAVILEIGRYDATPEATTRIIQASQKAADFGEKHRSAIEDYLGSTFRRLLGAL